MDKKYWRLIWNCINILAILYIIALVGTYIFACVVDGFYDIATNASLDDGWLFVTMISLIVVLINPIADAVWKQVLWVKDKIKVNVEIDKKEVTKKTSK